MKQRSGRPHLTIAGKLCDEEQPCAHALYDQETERLGRIMGSIVTVMVGGTGTAICFAAGWVVAGTLMLAGTIILAILIGLLYRVERRH